ARWRTDLYRYVRRTFGQRVPDSDARLRRRLLFILLVSSARSDPERDRDHEGEHQAAGGDRPPPPPRPALAYFERGETRLAILDPLVAISGAHGRRSYQPGSRARPRRRRLRIAPSWANAKAPTMAKTNTVHGNGLIGA